MNLQKVKIIDKAASTENPDGEHEFSIDGHPIRICSYSVQRPSAGAICMVTFTIEAEEVLLEHKL